MNAFFHAIAFMTRLPVPRLKYSTEDWQLSVAYYPIVGLMIGMLLWGAAWGSAHLFSPFLASVLTLSFWIYVTGGLHLDGWMDLADGLGSNRSREEVLRIMKDSRVGAMGVIAALLLILLKTAALQEAMNLQILEWLLFPPLLARTLLILAIWHWPYLSETGMGSGMRDGLNRIKLAIGVLLSMGVGYGLGGMKGIFLFLLILLAGWLFLRHIMKRLGGLTGDVYGALVEGAECLTLLGLLIMGRWLG